MPVTENIDKHFGAANFQAATNSEATMTTFVPVRIRLETELNDHITAIAKALDRPKAWVLEQAVRDFVAVQEWQLAAIDEGIKQADTGQLVPHEDVVAWVRSWGSPDELPMPKCD